MNRAYKSGGNDQFNRKAQALRVLAIALVFLVLWGFALKIVFF